METKTHFTGTSRKIVRTITMAVFFIMCICYGIILFIIALELLVPNGTSGFGTTFVSAIMLLGIYKCWKIGRHITLRWVPYLPQEIKEKDPEYKFKKQREKEMKHFGVIQPQ